jgi:two-component system, chemotaxis family, chemotaxis protein CheY
MGVFTDNRKKDSQLGFNVPSGHPGLQELSPSVILLVDDDPDIRVLTRTFLEHEGYSVFSASDADRASYIFRNVPQIDLLVTDLYMPERSGLELGTELKKIRSDLPVLLISGGMVDKELAVTLEEKNWSFLGKPFRLPDLLTTVHRILAPIEARRWRVAKQGVPMDELLPRHD